MFTPRYTIYGLPILAILAMTLSRPAEVSAEPIPPAAVFDKDLPESLDELRSIQDRVREIASKVIPATVNVRVGPSQGSGVIIDGGYILTAGHVSGAPGRNVTITLHDGKTIKGETLGRNSAIDSGLIKITTEGDFPSVEKGASADMERGKWVIAVGHPGGYRAGRPPVVRVGRIVSNNSMSVRTDCALVGGDSGGPLFDIDGKVIGIHSRIGGSITANHHVPIDTYEDTWDRLVKGEEWGSRFGATSPPPRRNEEQAHYGIQFDPASTDEVRILRVVEGSPAEKGGLQDGDVILKCEGEKVNNLTELRNKIRSYKPGDKVSFEVKRGDAVVTIRVTAGKRED